MHYRIMLIVSYEDGGGGGGAWLVLSKINDFIGLIMSFSS